MEKRLLTLLRELGATSLEDSRINCLPSLMLLFS